MKTIGHYRKEHALLHQRIAQLEREPAALRELLLEKSDENGELRADVAALRDQITALIAQHERAIAAAIDNCDVQIAARAILLAERDRTIAALTSERDAALSTLAGYADELGDARALVDRHLDRMNRRERAEASALLNRAALASIVPGANRR